MKNSLLALALAAATMPLTFAGQAAPAAQTPSANPPAATSTKTHKTKKAKVKKSHVKKNKGTTGSTSGTSK